MANRSKKVKRTTTVNALLIRLVCAILVPAATVITIMLALLVWNANQYQLILQNVTKASAFNQDFKSDVDLKMFYFVSESAYANGMPLEEVKAARELAEELLQNTTEKNSIEAIESVINLCNTLELRMYDIEACETYDERVTQLDTNIYILTDLIESYMYTYMYYESSHLSAIQQDIRVQIIRLIFVLLVGFIVLEIILIIYARITTRRITVPLTELTRRVEDITKGDFEPREPIEASEIEIKSLSDGFEEMVGQLNKLIKANQQAERNKRRAELELLQAQINPHFLYNTLDTIIWLIESDSKQKSIEMVSNLSDFFRSSLSKGEDVISLKEEVKHVLAYLQIQKVRYQDRMDYEISMAEDLNHYILPKLTLQPLVENSIYHGIKMQRGKGQIRISVMSVNDEIEIRVKDNGAGMDEERLSELRNAISYGEKVGFGLRTVHERIQLLFGESYGLEVDSSQGVGTVVTIHIPKVTKNDAIDE